MHSATLFQFLFLLASSLLNFLERAASTSLNRRVLEYRVYEELPLGTTVGDVKTDSNFHHSLSESDLNRLRFSLKPSSFPFHSSHLFCIDEVLGVIRTSMSIDREVLCPFKLDCRIDIEVKVLPREFFENLKVAIHILDLNDNAPRFSENRVSLSLEKTSHTGSLLNLPSADDLDSGKLGVQRYQLISDSDKFELSVSDLFDGSNDLALRLVQGLDDNDARDRYSMVVIAIDGGIPPKSGSLVIDVAIIDRESVSSHRFENDSYEAAIVESSAPGTTVVVVRATTSSSLHLSSVGGGRGGSATKHTLILSYGFTEQTELLHGKTFGIRNTTGVIILKDALDYEVTSSYQLTVTATTTTTTTAAVSLGQQQQRTAAIFSRVTVHVLDENDNAPQLIINTAGDGECSSKTGCRIQMTENSEPAEQFVAHVSVRDADSGQNGEVSCSLAETSLFRMMAPYKSDYTIMTATRLDRETASDHLVTVRCTDHGAVMLTTTVDILVEVLDENDNAPEIGGVSEGGEGGKGGGVGHRVVVETMENNIHGVELVKLNATDRDIGRNSRLMFQLEPVNGTPLDSAVVDPGTGSVRANQVFDCEQFRTYEYIVTVADDGLPALSTRVSLQLVIVDKNDNLPRFDLLEYHFTVKENSDPVEVGEVRATDSDFSSQFNRVVYRFRTDDTRFHIDRHSGRIDSKFQLDREEKALYILTVIASNDIMSLVESSQQSTVNVTIQVTDENDNAPIIVNRNKYGHPLRMSRGSENGTVLTILEGWDADLGPSATLVYAIVSGNEDGHFELTKETGQLRLINNIDLSYIYKLTAEVSDCGDPPLMTSVQLNIHVVDITELESRSTNSDIFSSDRLNGLNLFVVVVVIGVVFGVLICVGVSVTLICVRRKGKALRSRRDFRPPSERRDVAEGEAEDEKDVEHRGGSGGGRDSLYSEVTRSLELAQAICRSVELNKNSMLLTKDGKLLEDVFPNWSLDRQSCASYGISRPTTESLPRQKLTCSRPPPAVPHNRHRLRRHHHRCGSTRPCTHPANADQLCGQCMSLQPFLCQSVVGHRRCASSSLDDTLEKCDRISQNGIKTCEGRHWSWHVRKSDNEYSTDSSLTSSSLTTDSERDPSAGDDRHTDPSHPRQSRQMTSRPNDNGLEGREHEANELNAGERMHTDK